MRIAIVLAFIASSLLLLAYRARPQQVVGSYMPNTPARRQALVHADNLQERMNGNV